jgi:threonylcarbamoyladenosine tRNA methylthiotransferase MtaB
MLEELSDQLHNEFIEANKGIREKVLFESTDRNGMMEGYTGNYIRISRPYDPDSIGQIVDVVI